MRRTACSPLLFKGTKVNRICIFVDGENFRHSIVGLFRDEFEERDYLPREANWTALFERFSRGHRYEGQLVRAYWYAIRSIEFWPYNLDRKKTTQDTDRLRAILSNHAPFRTELDGILNQEKQVARMTEIVSQLNRLQEEIKRRFEGWTRVQDGIASRHDAIEFRRAGVIRHNLFENRLGREKSVDVKLACDMASLKDIYDVAVIVSGDQDYVPAVELVKDYGKWVANVAFKDRSGKLLPGRARELNRVSDTSIVIEHGELAHYLKLQPKHS